MRLFGIFAKEPVAGEAKTRLAEGASPEWAARVHAALLGDSVARFRACGDARRIGFSPPGAAGFFEQLAGDDYRLWPQPPGDLGERMQRFFADAFDSGATRVVLVGSDSPTLPIQYVEEAFELLDDSDVVIGPATDGGYYLVGMRRRTDTGSRTTAVCSGAAMVLFEGVDWSSAQLLEQTVAAVRRTGLKLSLLPPWYDVDTPRDWAFLRGHVAAMRAAGVDPEIPETERQL